MKKKDYNGVNNYLEVTDNPISEVKNSNHGNIRYRSYRGYKLADDCPMAHEFGHLLGLADKYIKDSNETDGGYPVSDEWIGNVMAEPTYITTSVDEKNMDILLEPRLNFQKYGIPHKFFYDPDPLPHWISPSSTFYINEYNKPRNQ